MLCDPALRAGLIDRLKCVPLAADGSAWLSLGGEIRERYEYTHNPLWGEDPQDDNGVFLQRYMLQGDLRAGPNLRLFGQLYSALAAGRAGPTSPVDENQLDVQQAFVELSAPLPEDSSGMVRAGRQELRYGSGRLVDVREGPNVRRKFDGGLGRLTMDNWRLDVIAARPADDEPGFFDDGTNGSQALWGGYRYRPIAGLAASSAAPSISIISATATTTPPTSRARTPRRGIRRAHGSGASRPDGTGTGSWSVRPASSAMATSGPGAPPPTPATRGMRRR